jgi:PAS domain S-box-containing protein
MEGLTLPKQWRIPLKHLRLLREHAGNAAIPLAVLLIAGTTLSWVAYDEYLEAQDAEYRLLEAHARNADVRIEEALRKIGRLLNQIAGERLNNRSLKGKAFAAVLERHKQDIPELGTLLVSDAAGRILSATDATIVSRDISSESYFTAHTSPGQTQKLFMSRPDKLLLGLTAVTFTLPIVGPDQQFIGIAGVTIGFKFFSSVLQAINPDDSASMSVIFNRDGDILYRIGDPEKFFGYNIVKASTVFREHASSRRQVTRHIGPSAHDGKTRLFLVREVGDSGIGLILSRQLDAVLAAWQRNVVIYALIFIFILAVAVAFAITTARRKQLESCTLEALSRFHKIASLVPGLVYQCRLHSDGHYSFPYASDAIREIFQLSPQEVREDAYKIFSLIHSSDYDDVVNSIQKSARDLAPWHHEFRVKLDDGSMHWLLGNALPQRDADGSVLWHGFITDITGRKQMEKNIVEAKHQAEEANLAKSKFLAAASHDLRQPIHAQGLFLDVLSHTRLTAQQRDLLTNICAASNASAEMINTLLDFSRIEAGVIEPQLQTFSLQPLLNKIEREFGLQADASGLVYRSRETDLVLQSDPALIELILRNLVSNAIRYTERGGLLVACRKHNGQAVLEVWDTGIGITPAHQHEVFREFHQLGNPERDRRKGLGLGLAIAQGLARTLGHELTMASTPHRGSVFRLALPIATAALAVAQPSVAYDMSRLFNVRVLVIEDDETVRSGMLHLLGGWGCVCEASETIEEALELARHRAPDIVISDYRLRGQRTGMEAIAALRALLGDALPALLVTGDTAPDRLRMALASGIPLLHKPVATSLLYRDMVTAIESC